MSRSELRLDDSSFAALPDEVLLSILSFLPISDLLQCSRTCWRLRALSADPILHHERLQFAGQSLERGLMRRKTRAAISPPNAWIWLSRTNILSRSISKSLIRIRLSHSLQSRPSSRDLVKRAILPSNAARVSPALVQSQRAIHKNRLKDGLCRKLERRPSMKSLVSLNIIPEECAKRTVSPLIVDARRKVIKENLKDGLRAWVENRGLRAQRKRAIELDETERCTVKVLVRRLTAQRLAVEVEHKLDTASMEKKRAQARWGRALEAQRTKEARKANGQNAGCAHPTRAHVSGLKRYWEDVIRTATTS